MHRDKASDPVLAGARLPLLGFAAYSGTGKTTLLRQLLPLLGEHGLRLGMVKHAHHRSFEVDQPGKDSYELRKAGATQVLVASSVRWALMVETPERAQDHHAYQPDLAELLAHLDQDALDLILVEGFKHVPFPKIELHRPELGRPLLYPKQSSILAIATNTTLAAEPGIPVLDLNDPPAIANFVIDRILNAGR